MSSGALAVDLATLATLDPLAYRRAHIAEHGLPACDLDGLPDVLKGFPHWTIWGVPLLPNEDRRRPFSERVYTTRPPALHPARPDKFWSWMAYEHALAAAERHGAQGLGWMFGPRRLGFWAVDIDRCVVDGRIDPRVEALCTRFGLWDTYAEVSPSGSGLHLLSRGNLPITGTTGVLHGVKVEIKGRTHHLRLSGWHHPAFARDLRKLPERTALALLDALAAPPPRRVTPLGPPPDLRVVPSPAAPATPVDAPPRPVPPKTALRAGLPKSVLSDAGVLSMLKKCPGDGLLQLLWDADPRAERRTTHADGRDWEDFSSEDCALVARLLFWTGGDLEQLERLLWRSKRPRTKWATAPPPNGDYLAWHGVAPERVTYLQNLIASVAVWYAGRGGAVYRPTPRAKAEKPDPQALVLATIRAAATPPTAVEVEDALRGTLGRNAVGTALGSLTTGGCLLRSGSGKKADPYRYTPTGGPLANVSSL